MLAAGLLAAHLLQPGVCLQPPQRPAEFRGPAVVSRPLDVELAGRDPRTVLPGSGAAWCPVGPDFVRWQAERERQAEAFRRVTPRPKHHGATPEVTLDNGVVVMEDDGTLMRYDRRPDLEGVALEYTPQPGGGYSVAVLPATYDSAIGVQVLTNTRDYQEAAIALGGITFPFGGAPQAQFWITSAMTIDFVDPSPPGAAQLHLSDVLSDTTPRIGPLGSGTSLYGWNAYVREGVDRALVTWQANDGGALDMLVQATLFADGRILFDYERLRGVQHGSVEIVDGDPAWWGDRQPMGDVTDPAGNVTTPAPDGPAIDVVDVRAFQIAGSEVMELEVQLSTPLPAATDNELEFAIELRDEAGGGVFDTIWAAWNDGAWAWGNRPVEIVGAGDTLRFRLLRSDLPLTDDALNIVAWSADAWDWQQAISADLAYPVTPPDRLMRDFSAGPLTAVHGPLIESFTRPELLPGAIYDVFSRHFDSPRIDGLAIFQNFETDIVYYAGAYSTVGNAGADGIGTGNSTDPESPALLHMNELRYGWNAWDEGKTLVLNHEFGHHWLYNPSLMEGGVAVRPLGQGHPAGWVHMPAATPVFRPDDASCMGGSTWTDNMDGTFRSAPVMVNHGYTWHELYMMGLADPTEVTDWYYIRDPIPSLPGAYWPPDNSLVTGTRVDVTLQQLIDAMGPRNPARAVRTDFLVPIVLIVRPGEWSQADADEAARECAVWAPGFHTATIDRATVTCDRVGYRPPDCTITNPAGPGITTITAGDTLSFTGVGTDPDEDVVDLTWTFDGAAADATGEGPHDVTFDTAGVYYVYLNAHDSSGADDPTPDLRIINVVCADPAVVDGLRVAHDRFTTISFAWTDLVPMPDEYAVFSTTDLRGTPFAEVGAGMSGLTLPMPMPAGPPIFFKVAARNLPDCLGPLDP